MERLTDSELAGRFREAIRDVRWPMNLRAVVGVTSGLDHADRAARFVTITIDETGVEDFPDDAVISAIGRIHEAASQVREQVYVRVTDTAPSEEPDPVRL